MEFKKHFLRGAAAAVIATAHPVSLEDRTPTQIEWQQTDSLSHASKLLGLKKDFLEKNYNIRWAYRDMSSPNRKTIFLGQQMHQDQNDESMTALFRNEVVENQASLAAVILNLWKRKEIQCIYNEGEYEESVKVWENMRPLLVKSRSQVTEIEQVTRELLQKGSMDITAALQAYGLLVKRMGDMAGFTEYHLFGDKTFATADSLLPWMENRLRGDGSSAAQDLLAQVKSLSGAKKRFLEMRGKPNMLVHGAVFYLGIVHDIPVEMCPTTTPEVSAEANTAQNILRTAEKAPTGFEEEIAVAQEKSRLLKEQSEQAVGKSFLEWLDATTAHYRAEDAVRALQVQHNAKRQEIIEQAKTKTNPVIFDLRERTALKFIHEREAHTPGKVVYLHFGAGHKKFGERIQELPPEERFNLLEISPKSKDEIVGVPRPKK